MQIALLDLKAQYNTCRDEITRAITDVCESQAFALGPAVTAFEKNIARYCGCEYAIGVSSGTDALLIALMALDIQPGDEVITSPFTFFASAGSIARLGATPVFADIDPDSYNIDPASMEQKVTEKTRALMPVHLFGQVARMNDIAAIASRYNLSIVEDAAQAIGAAREDKKAGGFGDCGCFSFYPTKNLNAFGDAGLVVTNSEDTAEKLKILRNHGQNPTYFYKVIGGNFRLDSIQAAVLDVKLKYLEGWNEKRRQHAAMYDEILADSPVETPRIDPEAMSIYHQYTIKAPDRDALKDFLTENGVGSAIFYPKPLHLQDCFKSLGYNEGDLPVAEKLCSEVLSLPIYPELTGEQIEYVASTVMKFYG